LPLASGQRTSTGPDSSVGVWSPAKADGFVIVTGDSDFLARALVRGHPLQVVSVCLGNASTTRIAEVLIAHIDDIERFVAKSQDSVFLLRG